MRVRRHYWDASATSGIERMPRRDHWNRDGPFRDGWEREGALGKAIVADEAGGAGERKVTHL